MIDRIGGIRALTNLVTLILEISLLICEYPFDLLIFPSYMWEDRRQIADSPGFLFGSVAV